MDEQKNMGFSIELENGQCNIKVYGDANTIVNLAITALATMVAETSETKEEADNTRSDARIALILALETAWKDKESSIKAADDATTSGAAQAVMQEA